MIKYRIVPRRNPILKETLYQAVVAPVSPLTLAEVAQLISTQCTMTVHDVKAVLSALQYQMAALLAEGHSIRLGDLGSFCPTLCSKATTDPTAFSAKNVLRVGVRFTPSAALRQRFDIDNVGLQNVTA